MSQAKRALVERRLAWEQKVNLSIDARKRLDVLVRYLWSETINSILRAAPVAD